jgi:hypothetical protein
MYSLSTVRLLDNEGNTAANASLNETGRLEHASAPASIVSTITSTGPT